MLRSAKALTLICAFALAGCKIGGAIETSEDGKVSTQIVDIPQRYKGVCLSFEGTDADCIDVLKSPSGKKGAFVFSDTDSGEDAVLYWMGSVHTNPGTRQTSSSTTQEHIIQLRNTAKSSFVHYPMIYDNQTHQFSVFSFRQQKDEFLNLKCAENEETGNYRCNTSNVSLAFNLLFDIDYENGSLIEGYFIPK